MKVECAGKDCENDDKGLGAICTPRCAEPWLSVLSFRRVVDLWPDWIAENLEDIKWLGTRYLSLYEQVSASS